MGTIAEVTEDRPSAVASDAVGQQRAALSAQRVGERRSLLVPVLSTGCAALIAGVLTMAVVGFNTLRDEISSVRGEIGSVRAEIGMLRDDMHTEIGSVRGEIGMLRDDMHTEIGMLRNDMNARFAQVDERFGEVNAILLDHTERLTRIETTQNVKSPPAQQP